MKEKRKAEKVKSFRKNGNDKLTKQFKPKYKTLALFSVFM